MPQRDWEVNDPENLHRILSIYENIQKDFNGRQVGSKKVSLADLIVLGGAAGIEEGARKSGMNLEVPFYPRRNDATQDITDKITFDILEPKADGFINYLKYKYSVKPEEMLIDKDQLLGLTAPEMIVLVGGLSVLNANYKKSQNGVFTKNPESLTNDYFINLLDMNTKWKPTGGDKDIFEGTD